MTILVAASNASGASQERTASTASHASHASTPSHASHASTPSHASHAASGGRDARRARPGPAGAAGHGVGLVAATPAGRGLAAHLARSWREARTYEGPAREALAAAWAECRAVVLFMATGAAVRLAAPLLAGKRTDPGIVCVDDAGRHAVALVGGHEGGANALARAVAEVLGCVPVVTTASDAAGCPSLDAFGADLGFRLDPGSDVARVASAILSGDPVTLVSQLRWPLPPMPPNVVAAAHPAYPAHPGVTGDPRVAGDPHPRVAGDPRVAGEPGRPEREHPGGPGRPGPPGHPVRQGPPDHQGLPRHPNDRGGPCIVVSDLEADAEVLDRPTVLYRPPSLVVGMGCSRGATADEILELVDSALSGAGLCRECVRALATVEAKRDEPGLVEAAARRGWPLECFPADRLAQVPVPNPSEAARRAVGTPSVAEAAALSAGATLVVPKCRSAHVTAAVARIRPRGRLHLVGAGPGDPGLVPPMAREALARSEYVIGLDRYVDAVRAFLRPGTRVEPSALGSEGYRARRAVALAECGASVALVSSGDAGVYGMASPALAAAGVEVEVVGVPGVTAAHAAAALLGAPLGHDHCAISLSDLLTPWETIRRRLSAAAAGDFVVALYNPRSRGRDWQLAEARRLLLRHRSPQTPAGVVTDAFRPGQAVLLTTLGDLDVAQAGMTTTVIVGSSSTVVAGGRMVTPRGYRSQPPQPPPGVQLEPCLQASQAEQAPQAAGPSEVSEVSAAPGPQSVPQVSRSLQSPPGPQPGPLSQLEPLSQPGALSQALQAPPVPSVPQAPPVPSAPTCLEGPTSLRARPRKALRSSASQHPSPSPHGVPPWRSVHLIETESYRILREAVDLSHLPPLSRAVAERIVHATADVDIAGTLVLDEAALIAGHEALRAGAPVVVDSRMVRAGITSRPVLCALDLDAPGYGEPGYDAPGDESPGHRGGGYVEPGYVEPGYVEPRHGQLPGDAPSDEAAVHERRGYGGLGCRAPGYQMKGLTRSARSVRRAAAIVGPGAVWVVGCAPTALFEILTSAERPALVVGLPVGFVGAAESKAALASSGLPALTNRGPKGGSAAAAAALNALLYDGALDRPGDPR